MATINLTYTSNKPGASFTHTERWLSDTWCEISYTITAPSGFRFQSGSYTKDGGYGGTIYYYPDQSSWNKITVTLSSGQTSASIVVSLVFEEDVRRIDYEPDSDSTPQYVYSQSVAHGGSVNLYDAKYSRSDYIQIRWKDDNGSPYYFDQSVSFDEIDPDAHRLRLWPIWGHRVEFLGRDGSLLKTELVEDGGSATAPTPPTIPNMTFDSWSRSFSSVTSNVVTTAIYIGNSYGVTLHTNGGAIASGNVTSYAYGTGATLPTAVTKTGYTFAGWYANAELTGSPVTAIVTTEYGDKEFWAKWTVQSHTVTFNDWDGSFLFSTSVHHGSDCNPPPDPTRDGYTFEGWDGNLTNVTEDRTATATYSANTYTVTLNANGGTIATGKGVTSYTTGVGATLPGAADVTKTGNTFLGWYANADLTGSPVTAITATDYGNKAYWAKWSANWYDVTLNTNGGSIVSGDVQRYRYGDGATLPTNVTREGYGFAGWYANQGLTGSPVASIGATETGNREYWAKWAAIHAVRFFDRDGETQIGATQNVVDGGDAVPPDPPQHEGWTFADWDGDYTGVTEDLDLTATFERIELTVTFKDGLDGTVISTETVEWGEAATAPTGQDIPTHEGYTFKQWDRDFSRVTEDMTVRAVYSGAATYRIRGRRWQRLYTADSATPVYAAESEASLAARRLCEVPWTETAGDFTACLPAHAGTSEADEHNLGNRQYFDAAAFCGGHENGMHRVYVQGTCYRFALPESAQGERMNSLSMVVSGDPYLRDGARIAVLTGDSEAIPTDCATCRGEGEGGIRAAGVVPRTVSPDGTRWYGRTDTLQFTPEDGLELGKYLFVFVLLENYAYSRGEYVEGAACIQPVLEIGMSDVVSDWDLDEVNDCSADLEHVYNVNEMGALPSHTGEVSGVQTITLTGRGDPDAKGTTTSYSTSSIGLRSVYAAFYEGRLNAVPTSVAISGGLREGAAFVVRAEKDASSSNIRRWELTTAALLVPFAVPVAFRANKVNLSWFWLPSSHNTEGGRLNVWLKRGTHVKDYPADLLRRPEIYDASLDTVDGWELLGTVDANLASNQVTLPLGDPLGGYVATLMFTAFISLDDFNPDSGLIPSGSTSKAYGVATGIHVAPDGSSMSGHVTGWYPTIRLIG